MRCGHILISVFAAIVLTGCATEPKPAAPLLGMSRDELRARCGEPLRIERNDSGGEDWYYRFSRWGNPEVQASSVPDAVSSSVAVNLTGTRIVEKCPIHLSPDGYVIAPLPRGKLVRP